MLQLILKNSMTCSEFYCGLVLNIILWCIKAYSGTCTQYNGSGRSMSYMALLFRKYIPFLIVQIFQFSQKLISFPQQIKMAPINRYNLIHNFTYQ